MEGMPLDVDLSVFAASGRHDAALDAASSAVRCKCELALEVLADRRWDMLAVNFIEVDRMQRWCWHVTDTSHPAYRKDVAARHGECLDDIYVEVDRAIGRLHDDILRAKTLFMLFYNQSLRTRNSFEAGMTQFGGTRTFWTPARSTPRHWKARR